MSYFNNDSKIDEWLIKRREKFTSSEVFKLLRNSKQGKDELWSATANTYINDKVIEVMTVYYERPELEEVESLLHGKINQYPAYERYIEETKNYSMTYLGDETPLFYPSKDMPDESGGSPDIVNITEGGTIDFLSEIKNPSNPSYHFKRLDWTTQWDVKEGYLQAYTQIQDLISKTGAHGADFISFDKRQRSKKEQIVIIPIKPDLKFIDNLEMRIQLAVKEKYKILSKK
jgi:hypothetical protein